MIEATNAGVRAGGSWILRDISLRLLPGTLTAVLGPNGAGKSTLLRLLSGERRPDAGTVRLDGAPAAAIPPLTLARRRAVLSQDQAMEFGLTVEEVVALGRLPHRGTPAAREDRRALAAVRADFQLEALWTRQFPTLSGGERQRAHLARAAAQLWRPDERHHGNILFLDEPAAALDLAQQRRAILFATAMARRGAAVLAVLHDPNHAALAHHVVLLRQGRLLAAGPVREVLTGPQLSACFGVDVEQVARAGGGAVFVAG